MKTVNLIKNNFVYFSHYRAGKLYYILKTNEKNYMFNVPVEDIGDATFLNKDKAIYFLRYIQKSIKNKSFIEIKN